MEDLKSIKSIKEKALLNHKFLTEIIEMAEAMEQISNILIKYNNKIVAENDLNNKTYEDE